MRWLYKIPMKWYMHTFKPAAGVGNWFPKISSSIWLENQAIAIYVRELNFGWQH